MGARAIYIDSQMDDSVGGGTADAARGKTQGELGLCPPGDCEVEHNAGEEIPLAVRGRLG